MHERDGLRAVPLLFWFDTWGSLRDAQRLQFPELAQ